jgi:alkylhydroperoxidase family enzyme
VTEVLEQQVARWGTTLNPYEIYARRPSILTAVVGMWEGLQTSGLLDGKLTTLINRRVAALNGCVF